MVVPHDSLRKPRVSLINHTYLEKRARSKLSYMAKSVNLKLLSPDQFPFPYGIYRANFSEKMRYQVQVYPCRFPAGVRTSTRWILATRDLGFRRFQPDIIHVENEAHSFILLQALLYRRLYAPKAKVIVFVWANQRLKGVKGRILNFLALLMRSKIDFYIAGNLEAKVLLMQGGIPADRVMVFPLVGVDMEYYKPALPAERQRLRAKIGIAPDEFVIGYVGRFVKDKGIFDLLKAFRILQVQISRIRVRLLCIGNGPLKEYLVSQKPDVLIFSPGGASEVLPYYQVMNILVLPSRTMPGWKEQFGLVLTEAMACGVPVVGSSSGAIPEVIGDAGLVFPEGNEQQLARHLQSLRTSLDLRYRLSELGKHRATEEYGAKQIACRTIAVYQQLLNRSESAIV